MGFGESPKFDSNYSNDLVKSPKFKNLLKTFCNFSKNVL